MRRILMAITVILILVVGSALIFTPDGVMEGATNAGKNEPSSAPSVLAAAELAEEPAAAAATTLVVADAVVKPRQHVNLAMPVTGIVREILVNAGEVVAAGAVVLRLDSTHQLVAVAQAKVALQRAQANLADLKAGARTQEVAAAQAVVDATQAQLARLTEGARAGDTAAARAALSAAQAGLQDVLNGPDEEQLIAARADLAAAEATRHRAQSAYNQVKWRNDIGALPESLELQKATIAYEAAQARYDQLAKGANSAQISNAQSAVENARAELERVTAPPRDSEIAEATAELRRAQAQLELLEAGARTEAIAAAEAEVEAARVALLEAGVALAETELKAPFAGTVAALNVKLGEHLTAGVPVVQLGDLSVWQIETDDLTELDIVKVRQGSPVSITIDALPDLALSGVVSRIERIGEEKAGDVTYTVIIQPDHYTEQLAWNMTASVTIAAEAAVAVK